MTERSIDVLDEPLEIIRHYHIGTSYDAVSPFSGCFRWRAETIPVRNGFWITPLWTLRDIQARSWCRARIPTIPCKKVAMVYCFVVVMNDSVILASLARASSGVAMLAQMCCSGIPWLYHAAA